MIRADLQLLADRTPDVQERLSAPLRRPLRTKRTSPNPPEQHAFPPAPIPAWARASGRAGQGDPLFAAGASLALLDAHLRRDPPYAGALRQRLAVHSATATAKILRLYADAAALRDLRFAQSEDSGSAAKILSLWREIAGRPPSLDPRRIGEAAARLDLTPPDPDALVADLRQIVKSADNPVSSAAKAAAMGFEAFLDASSPEAEVLALWIADLILALRLRWHRPLSLIATTILDPALRLHDGGRRAKPGEPAWEKHAAAAIALAAASALDLAADFSRRAEVLLAVAPNLRAKPALKIVDLLLAEDCVSPAEAARRAPMTVRAARRLFDRLLALGAVRELTGRPAFRLYGL